MAVGSDGEFDRLCAQVRQNRFKVRMHAVLPGAQIHRADGQSFHDGPHLIQREAIGAGWIPIAEGAGEVALVGESEPERNRGIRGLRAGWDGRRLVGDIIHEHFPSSQTREALCVAGNSGILRPAAQFVFQFKNPLILGAARNPRRQIIRKDAYTTLGNVASDTASIMACKLGRK
jgi:hypothetical protein